MEIDKKIAVHAYKFDGTLYRTWEFPDLIEETEQYLCLNLQNTHIITRSDDGKRFFHSKLDRPTIWYFFKNEWYNMIVSKKGHKCYYYINIASPYIYEDEAIKYIDFDLDYRIPDARGTRINLLDVNEFAENQIKYHYPEKLIQKIKLVQKDLLEKFNRKEFAKFLDYDLIYHHENKRKKNG